MAIATPPTARQYLQFLYDSVTERLSLQAEQASKPEGERRQDMFYFMCEARDPSTDLPGHDEKSLRSESNTLLVAGSDTVAVTLSSLFFYLTGDPRRCQKLTHEIRSTFSSADDIVHGPKLSSCIYLRACIDEGMRLSPPVPGELSREVLPGGIIIKGEFFPPGTIVGTTEWANSRNRKVYGDPDVFRPERWIAGESVTKDEVARLRSNFHPFTSGTFSCLGKNLAMIELMITVARTLHRLDVRREPGSTVGGGADPKQYELIDAFTAVRHGPVVQFRKKVASLN